MGDVSYKPSWQFKMNDADVLISMPPSSGKLSLPVGDDYLLILSDGAGTQSNASNPKVYIRVTALSGNAGLPFSIRTFDSPS
ncbi:hypothetical protein ABW20_dc0105069 [Dactylellina cionopaga]|nr:hypothetical protein ABW20_dc0105069 [Dactylellina cionopaga]